MSQMYGITKEQRCETVRRKLVELHHRLENGWIYIGEHPADQAAFDLFTKLIKEYEQKYFEWQTLGGYGKVGYFT